MVGPVFPPHGATIVLDGEPDRIVLDDEPDEMDIDIHDANLDEEPTKTLARFQRVGEEGLDEPVLFTMDMVERLASRVRTVHSACTATNKLGLDPGAAGIWYQLTSRLPMDEFRWRRTMVGGRLNRIFRDGEASRVWVCAPLGWTPSTQRIRWCMSSGNDQETDSRRTSWVGHSNPKKIP